MAEIICESKQRYVLCGQSTSMKLHILSLNPQLYSTRRLLEEAQRSGHQVQVINYQKPLASLTPTTIPDVVLPRIAANMTQKGLEMIQTYEVNNVPTSLTSKALSSVRNKFQCLQQLSEAGFATPKSKLITPETNLEEIFDKRFRFPVLLKLAESTHGHGVILVRSERGLRRMMKTFHRFQPYLIQEFVKEAAGSDIRAFVVGDEIVASMRRIAKNGDFRSNLHRGGKAKSVKLSAAEQKMILGASKQLGISVAGVDLIMSSRGLLLIEVNASPGLEGIEKISQKNIARAIINYAEKLCH